ncbi:MAG TPA: hypothetical protein VIL72_12815, partial [Beijerinckiaceae bacterium]
IVKVKVLEVDKPRKRIGLTMRLDDEAGRTPPRGQSAPGGASRNDIRAHAPRPQAQQPASGAGGALAEAMRRAAEKRR